MVTRCSLFELGRETGRALVQGWIIMGEAGNSIDVLVGVKEISVAEVSGLLVPEEAFGANIEFVDSKLMKVILPGENQHGKNEVGEKL
jgi:hypothetical protein